MDLKYVVHEEVQQHLANGWEIISTLSGTHHGMHAILMGKAVE